MKNQKGITLIALIITIIVMLILAGVTISLIVGEDGILSKAQSAASQMSLAEVKERADLIKADLMMDIQIGDYESIVLRQEYMSRLAKEFGVSNDKIIGNKVIVSDGKYDIFVKNSNLDIEVKEHTEYKDLVSLKAIITPNQLDKTGTLDLSLEILGSYTGWEEYSQQKAEITTDVEKEQEVLKFLSQESGQEITSIDQFLVISLNNQYKSQSISHNTVEEWLSDPKILGLFGETEGTIEKERFYYFYYHQFVLKDGKAEGTMTEKEAINELYLTFLVNTGYYEYEYNKNTSDLILWVGETKKANELNVGDIRTTILTNNGKYNIKITSSENEIYSEIIYINNLTVQSKFVVPENGDWEVRTSSMGNAMVSYIGDEKEIIVPLIVGDTRITQLDSMGKNDKVEKVIVPEGIMYFSHVAFKDCTNLKEVVLPSSLVYTHTYTFDGCTALEKVNIPNSITEITPGFFWGCTSLKNITIPDSIKGISYAAFKNTGLTEIIIPNSVTIIEDNAFEGCKGLTEITIPDSVTTIEMEIFQDCTSLTKVILSNSLTRIPPAVFRRCTSLKEITIPNFITEISENAFEGCNGITIKFEVDSDSIPEGYETAWGASNATVLDVNNTKVNN